ncbi:nucleotide sugar dehydrogenase [Ancylomarina euxinus]|uniref:Nucleotide sugar dehydrogenase n=1 Tax=Ancylomarina euxinus TaxID=2283627 RepID=A0A425Y6Y3_9BACT|nr:nucleotide sugar dehydrogenase [Ancylomarina euxinus]MCZ4694019.1 nucleotide sugar dehydrogenase [Ancylomarina euxinus]MUP14561.1 nucleotide sugar dehydrogenase [Ancylomarina euxinus]RRG24110.1 nucleotide sugar dehydrogenase [Ancylomarina euxinus]
MDIMNRKIAVIGLGYVGLPLAVEFGKKYITAGFDINLTRISELESGNDRTLEVDKGDLAASELLVFTSVEEFLQQFDVFIVTVPTPIDKNKRPDLRPLLKASETVGKALKKGDVVIYESTVYPGATEEDCVPVLEMVSGLKYNKDFFCGYSPERINPGDKVHTVTKIQKVTSGSTPEVADFVDCLYSSIITAGTYKASSIKVAEAAKVIENSQRDINIAFVNELSVIFSRIGIDTHEVLEAAGTKWNFLPFKPGLVGGHCIGVDPYYLTQKAQELGYNPEIMLAGRRLNDRMPVFVASMVIKEMIKKKHRISDSKILVLGLTFKENCPDVRNSKVIALIHEFNEFGCEVDVYDPWADKQEVIDKYGIELLSCINGDKYDSIVLAVAHSEFKDLDYAALRNGGNAVIYDIKGVLPKEVVDCRL